LNDIGAVSGLPLFYEPFAGFDFLARHFVEDFILFIFGQTIKQIGDLLVFGFLFLHVLIEITADAGFPLHGKCTLDFSMAARSGHRPANPAGVFSRIDSIVRVLDGHRTLTKLRHILAPWTPPALLEFPAVQFSFRHFCLLDGKAVEIKTISGKISY
jgi:hypothetical protein